MNAQELLNKLNWMAACGEKLSDIKLLVRTFRPGSIGPLPAVAVKSVASGIDWDHDRLLIDPENPLTELSAQQVNAIKDESRRSGSHKSYLLHKENLALKAENATLKSYGAQAGDRDAQEALEVLRLLNTGHWRLTRHPADPDMTDEANRENAWSVERTTAPFCDGQNNRLWTGDTPLDAFARALAALDLP